MKRKIVKLSTPYLLTTLILSIFLLVFSAAITYKQFLELTKAEKRVVQSHKVILTAQELLSTVKDAETAQRGYLLTRDTVFLVPYKDAITYSAQIITDFKKLVGNNPEKQKAIDTLDFLIHKRFDIIAASIFKKDIELPLSSADKKSMLSRKDLVDKIRSKTNEIIKNEKMQLKIRESEHSEEVFLSPLTFLYTSLFALSIFIIAFFKIKSDLFHLKMANNQLLINKRLFEHSENISNICNWCWNLEANHLTFSNNIHYMLRCEKYDFKQTVEGFSKFVHPDDQHIITNGVKEALEIHKTAIVYYRVIRKDGVICYFKSESKMIQDNFHKNIMIGVISDISEQHHNNAILEEKLFDLERTNKELLAFNHVASHDLQEPLRKIQNFISRLDANEMESLSENGRTYFSRIKVAANRMQLLIDDLLAFSRTNKAEKVYELKDLNILLKISIQELAQSIEEKYATINTSALPSLNVIPFQIQQLFINIISNAIKYSKANVAPVITISSEIICGKDIIKSSFTSENKLHKITISDNGIGFDEEYAEDIFILFNRLHSDSEYCGTGIGLTICRKILENHNGYITAEGIPNVGSRFNIYLPMTE